jgi:gas vesicle protein
MRKRKYNDDDLPYIVVERRESGGSLLSFLWGALIGAGVALLYAPRSGRETRADIGLGARRLKRAAEDAARGVQDNIADAVDNVRSQVTGRVDHARNAFDVGRTAARESRADMERRVREARAGFETGVRSAAAGEEFLDDDEDV